MENTLSDMVKAADKCKSLGADIIEVRLDYLRKGPSFSSIEKLAKLNEITGLPLIFTVRPKWEGGNFKGDEGQRIETLKGAIETGFNYIDLEMKLDGKKRDELIASAKKKGVKTIVSYHNFQGTPYWKDIINQVNECINTRGDIAKVVYYNKSIDDAFNVLKAGSAAKKLHHNFTTMGMGPFGHVTRILAPAIGCELVYAALEGGKETAEGQIDIITLKEMWNLLGIR